MGEAERLLDGPDDPDGTGVGDRVRAVGWLDRHSPISVPWCGIFVAHCLRTALPDVPLPPMYARARPWKSWGEPAEPQVGAVLVFWHYHQKSPFGHVAFYRAEDDAAFHVLGGNQKDRILVQRYPKVRLVACRWPAGVERSGMTRRASPSEAEPFDGSWHHA